MIHTIDIDAFLKEQEVTLETTFDRKGSCELLRDYHFLFRTWVNDGLVPGPWPGTKRYDQKALDNALDKLSQLEQNRPTNAYDAWKEKHYDNKTEAYQVNEESAQ